MKLLTTPEDDLKFVSIVSSIIDVLADKYKPQIIAAIQIDNWFDHKWLGLSAKVLGRLSIWHKELRIPPFNPNRVKNQKVCQLKESGKYEEISVPLQLIKQPSPKNLHRKLKNSIDSGLFLWWSSNTVVNSKGSIMLNTQIKEDSSSWFASFEREPDWRINKTKGIPVSQLKQFLNVSSISE